jgi:hypothetical protein
LTCQPLHPFRRAQAEPCCRSKDNPEIDDGNNERRQLRAPAEKFRKPAIDGIERNHQDGAPGQYRHKGAYEDKRPIDEKGQQSEPDRKVDNVFAGEKLAERSQGRSFAESRCSIRTYLPPSRGDLDPDQAPAVPIGSSVMIGSPPPAPSGRP